MTTVRVFDPAMCCSTGICGPTVDPRLVRFAADLAWLEGAAVEVRRFNLAQEPAAFVAAPDVRAALEAKGDAALPIVEVDGAVKSSGAYPTRAELAVWAGVAPPAPSLIDDAVAELVALGAACASGSEPCFKFHYDRARKLGVTREDMLRAVGVAATVAPASAAMDALVERFLRRERSSGGAFAVRDRPASDALAPTPDAAPAPRKPCC